MRLLAVPSLGEPQSSTTSFFSHGAATGPSGPQQRIVEHVHRPVDDGNDFPRHRTPQRSFPECSSSSAVASSRPSSSPTASRGKSRGQYHHQNQDSRRDPFWFGGEPVGDTKPGTTAAVTVERARTPTTRGSVAPFSSSAAVTQPSSGLVPPYAECEELDRYPANLVAVPTGSQLYDVPRGYGGVDSFGSLERSFQRSVLQNAVTAAAALKREQQRRLKEELDAQIEDKKKRKLRQWEKEMVSVYGPASLAHLHAEGHPGHRDLPPHSTNAMPSSFGILPNNVEPSKQFLQYQKEQLGEDLRRQMEQHRVRKLYDDAYYAPPSESSGGLEDAMGRLRKERSGDPRAAWLVAWQEHQQAEGDRKKREAEILRQEEELRVAPHIADYSDRLIMANAVKKQKQAQLRDDLNQQLAEKQTRRKREWVVQ